MDDQQFDALARTMASGTTRRSALGILLGLAGLQLEGTEAAKRRKHENKARAAEKNKDHKVTICHRTHSKKNPFVEIEVDNHAIPAHEGHGDTIAPDFENDVENCGGCGIRCDDDDPCTKDTCVKGECVNEAIVCNDNNPCTDDECVDGDCVFTPVPGRECDDRDACTENDRCTATGACAGDPVICPGPGQVCLNGECVGCVGETCESVEPGCDDDPGCICFITQERTGFCHRSELCEGLKSCQTSADCPPDHPACSLATCCGPEQGPVCIRPCKGTSGLREAAVSGRTTAGQ